LTAACPITSFLLRSWIPLPFSARIVMLGSGIIFNLGYMLMLIRVLQRGHCLLGKLRQRERGMMPIPSNHFITLNTVLSPGHFHGYSTCSRTYYLDDIIYEHGHIIEPETVLLDTILHINVNLFDTSPRVLRFQREY